MAEGVSQTLPEVAFYGNNGVGYDALAAMVELLVVVGVVKHAIIWCRSEWRRQSR